MSRYNNKIVESKKLSKEQQLSGTPIQQMWHVLNFHEQRLLQIAQYMQNQERSNKQKINSQNEKSTTQHLVDYNTVLQSLDELKDRVSMLEKKFGTKESNNVTLSIEEELQNSTLDLSATN